MTDLGIIPALAGNTDFCIRKAYRGGDHPRSRGEYLQFPEQVLVGEGSSPLSRGILCLFDERYHFRGIIPALAGNTT